MPLPPALAARLKKRGILTAAREAQGILKLFCTLLLKNNRGENLRKNNKKHQFSS